MKLCKKCGTEKPLDNFYPKKPTGYLAWCKACFCQHTKNWIKNHPERWKEIHNAAARRWDAKHQQRRRVMTDNWKKNNPEKTRMQLRRAASKRRAIMRGVRIGRPDFPDIIRRDGGRCHICGKKVRPKDISFDHLIPISAGGPHSNANIALAHWLCNTRRGPGRIPAQLRIF